MVTSLEWDDLPLARKSLLPGKGFFLREDADPPVEGDELADATVVVIADADADGLTAAALVKTVHGELTLVPTEPRSLVGTLDYVADGIDHPSTVYILDLAPESFDEIATALADIVDAAEAVHWFDHHEWGNDLDEVIANAGADVVIGDSDEVSTADVTREELDVTDDQWLDLVSVVRDHDLWIRDDPRSDDVADYAYWSNPEEFIETISDHGADLPDDVMALLTERRTEKQALIDLAVARAEYRSIGEYTIGITYGRCSQNEVAEAMRQSGADAAVVIKPSGGISLRGTEYFKRCHEVAARLGGGGHPKAAGCKPAVFDDMLDYAHHWTTHGAAARHMVLDAFSTVVIETG